MSEVHRINSSKAAKKNKKIRAYDSRTKRDKEYAISKRPLPFVELTKDRDLDVLQLVSGMLLRGATFVEMQNAILDKFNKDLSIDQIRKYRDTCALVWQNELVMNFDAVIGKDLARIDYEQNELWKEWEKSKDGIVRKRKERTTSEGEAKSVTFNSENESEDIEMSGANIKIMEKILELDKERRKILGIYAPERKESETSKVPEKITINLVGNVNKVRPNAEDAQIVD